ncbi:MAG: glycosyltransferase [Pyrobaculum sp.]|uniref:glycosyltransferase n=1 Tax=Pyrobaculum sp. TaxID=2004705 RepID=UPI003EEA140A
MAAEAPELRGKIHVVYNPPPPETVAKNPAETPAFIYAGGGEAIKGFHIAAKTAKTLGESGVRAAMYFTGRYGNREAQLIAAIRARYPNLHVELLGYIPRKELIALHSRAWARLVPSIWEETFSYAVVEAALWETLPIASAVGAIPEILEGTPAMKYVTLPQEIPRRALEVAQAQYDALGNLAAKTKEAVKRKLEEQTIKKSLVEILAGRT